MRFGALCIKEPKLFCFNSAFPGYAAGLTEREEKLHGKAPVHKWLGVRRSRPGQLTCFSWEHKGLSSSLAAGNKMPVRSSGWILSCLDCKSPASAGFEAEVGSRGSVVRVGKRDVYNLPFSWKHHPANLKQTSLWSPHR